MEVILAATLKQCQLSIQNKLARNVIMEQFPFKGLKVCDFNQSKWRRCFHQILSAKISATLGGVAAAVPTSNEKAVCSHGTCAIRGARQSIELTN